MAKQSKRMMQARLLRSTAISWMPSLDTVGATDAWGVSVAGPSSAPQRWHEVGILERLLPSLGAHCEARPVELATCKVMLHMHLVCAGDVFVHVSSLCIVFAIGTLRLKQNIIRTCVCFFA